MTAPRRPPLRAAAWLVLVATLFAGHARADGNHGNSVRPTNFEGAVRMLRDEMAGLAREAKAPDAAPVEQRAVRIAGLAADAAGFLEAGQDAAQDSLADSTRASLQGAASDLAAVAGRLRLAASRRDAAGIARERGRLDAPFTLLDARVARRYTCPMHCDSGRTYDHPGDCPVCGMMLQLITDERYSAEVHARSRVVRAGVPVALDFQLRDPAGGTIANLEIVHEKPLHLIIVSRDLAWFAHVHPLLDGNGHFHLDTTFPAGGTYTLYHDFTPAGVGMQVVPVELTVQGAMPRPVPLVIDDADTVHVDGYDVTLSHTGLAPGLDCALTFTLMRDGAPVTDLEPFLGAMGHLVAISEDRANYVHSHPLSGAAPGPSVQFNTAFARIGTYKCWGQFQRHGQVITVPFVFAVTPDGHTHAGAPAAGR